MDKRDEFLKYEVAAELGLSEKVKMFGWKSLSSKETGRIGGLVTKKKKLLQQMNNNRQVNGEKAVGEYGQAQERT